MIYLRSGVMVKDRRNNEWGGTSTKAFQVYRLGLGCSYPVHYFKTAAVICIPVQQHFQVHQGGKDKFLKKQPDVMFVTAIPTATKTLPVV